MSTRPFIIDRKSSSTNNSNGNNAGPTSNAQTQQSASPPKRKSTVDGSNNSEVYSENGADENNKKRRRKVNHACVYCRRSHMTCDLERPCARCIKRDIGHLCHDEPREPPKRGKSENGTMAEIAPAPDHSSINGAGQVAFADMGPTMDGAGPTLVQPSPISPKQFRPQPNVPGVSNTAGGIDNMGGMGFDWNNSNNVQNQFQDMHHLHPNYMFNNSEVTNEYNMLNDFLSNSLNDDGLFNTNDNGISSDAANVFLNDPLLTGTASNTFQPLQQPQQRPQPTFNPQQSQQRQQPQQNQLLPPPPKILEEISRPGSAFPVSEATRNKFYMTAADPAGLSTGEDRLHKILKGKYDAGMLKPFNYVKGYARLNAYMAAHLSRESQVRILK